MQSSDPQEQQKIQNLSQFLISLQNTLIYKMDQTHQNEAKRLDDQLVELKSLKKQIKHKEL
ncbi:unnamed protein product [Paramecium primaurelia]|uniref:Uncharacterized protein n=3 Tax=Paramecium TaxID=5884 RepID=A0A8S1ULM4_PAROT|nr:unnamed protein product [Paramecium primaurelia]CAD8164602.1 unnamed protein product [Paramecium octaurelia]CAD8188437.1 unnamed protein product [Paramecium pentaurelia]